MTSSLPDVLTVWRSIGRGEDFRYRAMWAERRDSPWIVSPFQVFGLRGRDAGSSLRVVA